MLCTRTCQNALILCLLCQNGPKVSCEILYVRFNPSILNCWFVLVHFFLSSYAALCERQRSCLFLYETFRSSCVLCIVHNVAQRASTPILLFNPTETSISHVPNICVFVLLQTCAQTFGLPSLCSEHIQPQMNKPQRTSVPNKHSFQLYWFQFSLV